MLRQMNAVSQIALRIFQIVLGEEKITTLFLVGCLFTGNQNRFGVCILFEMQTL